MAKKISPAQLREARSKKIAIGLSVVFLGVLGVQGPKLMKALHGGSAPSGGTVAGALPAGVNPTLAHQETASAAPVIATSSLTSLSRFAAKDPFHSLVKTTDATSTAPPAPDKPKPAATPTPDTTQESPSSVKPDTTGKSDAPAKPAPPLETTTLPTQTFSIPKPVPNAAVLKTNGRKQILFVGDAFPSSEPMFRLVKLGKKTVEVSVLAGSFTSGAPTIKLPKGDLITLANEADGSRYVLELVNLTVATPKAPGAQTTPPATTTTTIDPTTTDLTTTTPADSAAAQTSASAG
jgi:hypothetical protein